MGTPIKIIIFIAVALVLTLLTFKVLIPGIKRRKLAQAWIPYLQKASLTITEDELVNELKKVPARDIDTLIDFSKLLQEKKYLEAGLMSLQVRKILQATDIKLEQLLGQ